MTINNCYTVEKISLVKDCIDLRGIMVITFLTHVIIIMPLGIKVDHPLEDGPNHPRPAKEIRVRVGLREKRAEIMWAGGLSHQE